MYEQEYADRLQQSALRAVFPAEMYKEDRYRVVFSQEEEAKWARLGWKQEIAVDKSREHYVAFDAPTLKPAGVALKGK